MPQAGRGVLCDHCDFRMQVDETFFHCRDCPDFDLCKRCYSSAITIHPADHSLAFRAPRNSEGLGPQCDNCHGNIVRALHFCKSCPNFNICNTCFASASTIHPESREFGTIGSAEESLYRCGHCNATISRVLFVCGDCPGFSLCKSCYPSAAEVHPAHSSWTPSCLSDTIRPAACNATAAITQFLAAFSITAKYVRTLLHATTASRLRRLPT
jgi:hypothetical protein